MDLRALKPVAKLKIGLFRPHFCPLLAVIWPRGLILLIFRILLSNGRLSRFGTKHRKIVGINEARSTPRSGNEAGKWVGLAFKVSFIEG